MGFSLQTHPFPGMYLPITCLPGKMPYHRITDKAINLFLSLSSLFFLPSLPPFLLFFLSSFLLFSLSFLPLTSEELRNFLEGIVEDKE